MTSDQLQDVDDKGERTGSIMYDSSSDDEEYSYLEDTSLSISKHVPSDTGDEGVDDIVAQAEAYLQIKHSDKPKKSAEDNNDNTEHSDIESDAEAPPLPEKKTSTSAHKYLSANEVITYEPDVIRLESEDGEADNKDMSEDIIGDTRDCDKVNKSKCWKDRLRTLDIEVPEEVTDYWLNRLSLATIHNDIKASIPNIIEDLQERIAINDPQEEFKQLRNVPITDECETATLQKNKVKNRFRNVLPCKYPLFFSIFHRNNTQIILRC